jgi:hypothetical protein
LIHINPVAGKPRLVRRLPAARRPAGWLRQVVVNGAGLPVGYLIQISMKSNAAG